MIPSQLWKFLPDKWQVNKYKIKKPSYYLNIRLLYT